MDEKAFKRPEVDDFLNRYHKFITQLEIIRKERENRKENDPDLEMMNWRFIKTCINPMEEAWAKLTDKEKECLIPILLQKKKLDTVKDAEDVVKESSYGNHLTKKKESS